VPAIGARPSYRHLLTSRGAKSRPPIHWPFGLRLELWQRSIVNTPGVNRERSSAKRPDPFGIGSRNGSWRVAVDRQSGVYCSRLYRAPLSTLTPLDHVCPKTDPGKAFQPTRPRYPQRESHAALSDLAFVGRGESAIKPVTNCAMSSHPLWAGGFCWSGTRSHHLRDSHFGLNDLDSVCALSTIRSPHLKIDRSSKSRSTDLNGSGFVFDVSGYGGSGHHAPTHGWAFKWPRPRAVRVIPAQDHRWFERTGHCHRMTLGASRTIPRPRTCRVPAMIFCTMQIPSSVLSIPIRSRYAA